MVPLLFLILTTTAVKDGGAALATGCSANSHTIRQLPAGTPLTIKYSLAGQAVPCYKVTAEVDGAQVEGYLPSAAFEDLDDFESARRQGGRIGGGTAPSPSGGQPERAAEPAPQTLAADAPAVARQALDLIDGEQPARALAMLESELAERPRLDLWELAGYAAWRADNPKKALEYWDKVLAVHADPEIERLHKQVEREMAADQSNQRLAGGRVMLRFEGMSISAGTAREMVKAVDQEFSRISQVLGCTTRERIVAVAQSREAYLKTTGAAEWSGGLYDGRIHVPVFDQGGLDANTRKTLAHETVHACLSLIGNWPTWLQEGLAQKLSGETLNPAVRAQIDELAAQGKLPSLSQLSGGWGGLDSASARLAYGVALRAVEIFDQDMSYGIRNLLANPSQLPRISGEIDKRLAE